MPGTSTSEIYAPETREPVFTVLKLDFPLEIELRNF